MPYPLAKKKVPMEGAPYWYGTHLDKLDFEWSMEEELELERYCERILKNIEEEGEMTPVDRAKAHWWSKEDDFKNADRKLMVYSGCVCYDTRTLDCHADALVPIDLYRSPKLHVKGKFASVARFKLDYMNTAMIVYTDDLWGQNARMIDYGNPSMVGEPCVKNEKDLEKVKASLKSTGGVPDPYTAGLYPGWLWFVREQRRIVDKYKLPIPLWISMCPGATEVCQLGMMGWTGFQMAVHRNEEFAKACANTAQEWCKRFIKAEIDVGHPEAIYCCQFTGGFRMTGHEWVADLWADLAKAGKEHSKKVSKHKVPGQPDGSLHLSHGYSFLSGVFEWYPILWDHMAFRPNIAFDGGHGGTSPDVDMEKVYDWHGTHNLFLASTGSNVTLEKGPISLIEEEYKALSARNAKYRKFTPAIVPVYFCPQAHAEAAVGFMKKYNKLSK